MSAVTAVRLRSDRLTGLTTVLRLGLRRERLPLIIWVLALAGTVLSSVAAITGLYPTETDRAQLAMSISANPAFLALTGPVTATSIGGVTAWRVGVLGGAAVALMGIFTVVRRTRAEEESGRAELLASSVVGRGTLLTAGLLLAWACTIGVGLISALGAVTNGQPVAGSLALGAALAGPGLVFAAVAAVCVQIFENARTATATAGALLAVTLGLRAVGDLTPGLRWLSWLSPLGWSQQVQAFGADRWPVLLLFVLATAALVAVSVMLSGRRDVGLGLLPTRLGPATDVHLRSGLALAVRLHRASWIGWAVGFLALGALTGSLAGSAGPLLRDTPRIQQMMQDLGGGPGTLTEELFAAMGGICALAAAAYSVSAALRVRGEETGGGAEAVLSTALSRGRWFGGHLLVSLLGSSLLLVIAGLAAGVVRGIDIGDLGAGSGVGLATMTVQIPAVLVVGGVAFAIIGWLPRLAPVTWAALGVAVLLGQVGKLLQLPQTVLDLSPFTHVPAVPVTEMRWTPILVLLGVTAAGCAVGTLAFDRRDIG